MNPKKLFIIIASCLFSLGSMADDYLLRGSELSLTKGTESATFNVYMDNVETVSNLQFDLYLPEGIDVYYGENEDEDMVYFISKGDRAKTAHTVSIAKHTDFYRVAISSTTNAEFKETAANRVKPIAVVTLDIDKDLDAKALDIVLKNVVLAHYDSQNQVTTKITPQDNFTACLIKPASGVEENTSNGVASFASAEGEKISKNIYQEYVESQSNLTAIDLRAAELGSDITCVDDLKPAGLGENAIILLPKDAAISGENVVIDHKCENLKLTDGERFAAPTQFKATVANYSRTTPASFGTICLPFTPDRANYTYYKLKSTSGSKLIFEIEDNPQANTPYLYRATNGNMTAANVSISTEGAGEFANAGWTMKGTFETSQFHAADNVYALFEGKIYRNTGALTMNPFRAYFTNDSSAGKFDIEIETPTGIQIISSDDLDTADGVYNVAGMKVGTDYKGVVISNGKKYINK